MSDQTARLVRQACSGDTTAVAGLYTSTVRPAYYLACKLSGSREEAVDILKKAYSKAFCTITKLKKPEAFETWVKQNIVTEFRNTREFSFEDASGDGKETPREFLSGDVYTDPDKAIKASQAVDGLKTELRTATVLHYFLNMPVPSIAKFFKVSESTVNSILDRAKEEIWQACDSGAPLASPVTATPVLSSILQNEMVTLDIDTQDVRDIFIYVQDIYNSFKNSDIGRSQMADYSVSSAAPWEPVIPQKPVKAQDDELGDTESRVDFGKFTDEETRSAPARQAGGFDFRKLLARVGRIEIAGRKLGDLNWKKIGLIAAAVLLVIIIIASIGKAAKNKKNPGGDPGTSTTGSATIKVKANDYTWVPGGFEDCAEIVFLDNNACAFKSVTTGKYGLLDYQGNVLLQPVYDGFKRCSNGRDYTTDDSSVSSNYHTLYTKDNEDFYVYYEKGTAIASTVPHASHGYNPQYLDSSVKYDERDRFYGEYAAAEKNGKWGYIDKTNEKKVIPYEYEAVNPIDSAAAKSCDYCRPVTDGLVAVKKNGMMGIINLDNDFIVPAEYTDIMVGSGGVFIARKDGTWGVILVGDAATTFKGVNIVITGVNDAEESTFDQEDEKYYICVADSGINIRSDAGGEFGKVGELAAGEEVRGFGTKTASTGKEWLKIEYNGVTGYVAMSYMREK